jgi:hypothetical protein
MSGMLRMPRPLTVAASLAIVLVGTAVTGVSIRAEDRAMQEDRGSWFKSLKQPATGMSCCDVSDCRRTDADYRAGQWWAVVENNWTPIPKEKELEKKSIDGDAYVCSGPRGTIYCFVPPSMAM